MKSLRLLAFLLPFLFCSCIWGPGKNLDFLQDKNFEKDVSNLNNTTVMAFPGIQTFYFYGNENNASTNIYFYFVYVIYDYETDSIYDWAAVPCSNDYLEPTVMYDFKDLKLLPVIRDNSVNILKNGEFKKYKLEKLEELRSGLVFGYSYYYTPDHICVSSIDDTRDQMEIPGLYYKVNIYNSSDLKYEGCVCIETDYMDSSEKLIADENGNYWMVYPDWKKDYLDNRFYNLAMIDCSEIKISEPILKFDDKCERNFYVCYVDEKYVVIAQNNYETNGDSCFIFVNKQDYSIKEIKCPLDFSNCNGCARIGTDYYLFATSITENKIYVLSEDLSNFDELKTDSEFKNLGSYYSKGTKLYFSGTDYFNKNYLISNYDVISGKYSGVSEISLDELSKSKE